MSSARSKKITQIQEVAAQIQTCRDCSLFKTATRSVPGAGNPEARVIFIGEAPGFHEDRQGLPFVGAAGKLLDRLLASIKLKREDIWIGNILKHRPPQNRDPQPEEVKACQGFLDAQIKIISPEIIATLGRFSLNKFLPNEKISRIHGQARYLQLDGQKILIPLYHPAAALRSSRIMQELQADFKKIAQFLNQPLPDLNQKMTSSPPEPQQMDLF